ncbi:beta-lactamase/transpeptidase-like protein [Lasiosphaeris hirsuta]|uniref:Beta-lactamase/transpeptidase-like protein n=1 Tax=Lasiosphaeris hirsuta TaxID=260670 RepID=A0AA40BD39_9PEZI|nr:beta-lactamase/transpeptidase-like protein [Lasiosphaeris hirsuta]
MGKRRGRRWAATCGLGEIVSRSWRKLLHLGLYKVQSVTGSTLLSELSPSIVDILRVSGAAGASVGILDGRTKEIHFAGYGRRDNEEGQTPDEYTLYHLASLSKFFTALAIALLVSDGKLSYDSTMRSLLPGFHHADKVISSDSTLMDFLSHRTGLASKNALWQQDGHELLLGANDTPSMVSYLETVHPLGKQWLYNNFGYDILAHVIKQASGLSWGEFVEERIIKPLKLHDTTTEVPTRRTNYAWGYMPGPTGELTNVGRPVIAAGTSQQGSNGIKSTTRDLLTFYSAILSARQDKTGSAARARGLPPPAVLKSLFEPQIPLNQDQDGQWYGAGWAIAELPAPLGSIGTNAMFVDQMPLVGRGCERSVGDGKQRGPTVWYHNGSLVGFFSSVYILPEDGTIIVVLVNSIPKNDAADWIGQLAVERMLGCPSVTRNDYVSLARKSAARYDRMWKTLLRDFEAGRAREPRLTRPVSDLAGCYYNKPRNFYIKVLYENNSLSFCFQGRSSQYHKLEPYGVDTFSWLLTEAQSRKKGRWPDLDIATYLFYFAVDMDQNHTLRWKHDPDVPDGEVFTKSKESPSMRKHDPYPPNSKVSTEPEKEPLRWTHDGL